MVNKLLLVLLLLPSVFYYFSSQIYSPWYLENLFATPLVFIVIYLVIAVCLFPLLTIRLFIITLILNFAITYIAILVTRSNSSQGSCNEQLSILQFNNGYNESNITQLANYLLDKDFDLVALQEITPFARSTLLRTLTPKYPHAISGISHKAYITTDQLVLSKHPLQQTKYHRDKTTAFVIQSLWLVDDYVIDLFTVHPPSPREYTLWKKRNTALYKLKTLVNQSSNDGVLALGDFNLSSYSPRIELFESALSTQSLGSWPNTWMIPEQLAIPIDHFYASSLIRICTRKTINSLNYSDHYAIETKVSL